MYTQAYIGLRSRSARRLQAEVITQSIYSSLSRRGDQKVTGFLQDPNLLPKQPPPMPQGVELPEAPPEKDPGTTMFIGPGSQELAREAIDLFGFKRVDVDSYINPVRVSHLTREEADFAEEYFASLPEAYFTIREQ